MEICWVKILTPVAGGSTGAYVVSPPWFFAVSDYLIAFTDHVMPESSDLAVFVPTTDDDDGVINLRMSAPRIYTVNGSLKRFRASRFFQSRYPDGLCIVIICYMKCSSLFYCSCLVMVLRLLKVLPSDRSPNH